MLKSNHPAISFSQEHGKIIVTSSARLCGTCVLPDTFPEIDFDSTGLCSYCRNEEIPSTPSVAEASACITELLEEAEPNRRYDCLMLYSGGKDSTFSLVTAVDTYHLRPLALTLDNGFLAQEARANIETMTKRMGVDHVFYRPPGNSMHRLYQLSLSEKFSAETVKYSTTSCGTCISVLFAAAFETCGREAIPLLVGGWSPGQLTGSAVVDSAFLTSVAQRHFESLARHDAGLLAPLLATCANAPSVSLFNPLYCGEYSEEEIIAKVTAFGWNNPKNLDSCSTNCSLNGFLIVDHYSRFGFHPYAYELSQHVRRGFLSRDAAVAKMRMTGIDSATVSMIGEAFLVT